MLFVDLIPGARCTLRVQIAGVVYKERKPQTTPLSCGISIATGSGGKPPITPCDGVLRRCENCGDTEGSVEAFVEAWAVSEVP